MTDSDQTLARIWPTIEIPTGRAALSYMNPLKPAYLICKEAILTLIERNVDVM